MAKKLFLDTNAILSLQKDILKSDFVISSVTLHELEHIKVSKNKDDETKYKARKAIHILDENPDKYEVIIPSDTTMKILNNLQLENNPDNLIIACAVEYNSNSPIIFVSDDICCRTIARDVAELEVKGIKVETESYTGFKEVKLNEKDMAYFYEHLNENIYDILPNQYLIIKDSLGEVVDKFRYDGEEYQNVKFGNIKSTYFGTVKPYDGDVFQQLALNSLLQNQITMLKGKAGSGKSYLAIGTLLHLLEKHKIDKIIVFCNTVATANSAKLGYLPGSKDEKLLESSIGNMLSAKLGGNMIVEQLIQDGKLVLLPMSDIRGYDTTGMNAGVYITEAQNMDISLMKLALQRIGEDCICVIDGDFEAQVDMAQYAGGNNGMRRMSEVFRGQDFYGEIELQNIYRSKIAKIAEMM